MLRRDGQGLGSIERSEDRIAVALCDLCDEVEDLEFVFHDENRFPTCRGFGRVFTGRRLCQQLAG